MSEKIRAHEIASEVSATSAEVIEKANDLGIGIKTASSGVTLEQAEEIANYMMTGKSALLKKKPAKPAKKEAKETKKQEVEAPKEEVSEDNSEKKVEAKAEKTEKLRKK